MSNAIHPLFDRNSRYRQATHETIWRDGGVSSVRRFFHDRLVEQLLLSSKLGGEEAELARRQLKELGCPV